MEDGNTREKSIQRTSYNFVEGSIWKGIIRMSWPMLFIMLFNFAVGFTDIYVAGLIGPDIQAAVGLVEQLYFLLIIFGNAISIGTVAIVSRAAGAEDMPSAETSARQSMGLGLIVSVILASVGAFAPEVIVLAVGVPPELHRIATVFVRIYALALGFNYLLIISNAVLRALGAPEKPMVSMAVYALLNVILDFSLVFGWYPFPAMGFRGIPMATAISVTAAMGVNIWFLARLHWPGFFRRLLTLSLSFVRRIIGVSWPMALVMLAWNAGTLVLYYILSHLKEHHIEVMAAYANGYRIEAIIFLPAFALNNAGAVLVGQNLGAGKPERAVRVGWQIALTAATLLGVVSGVLYIYAWDVARILAKDTLVLAETVTYLRYNLIAEPFMAVSLALGGGLQGAGDTKGVLAVIVAAMWLIRLPLAYILGVTLEWGPPGVWTAMIASMTIQGSLMALRFHLGKWKTADV